MSKKESFQASKAGKLADTITRVDAKVTSLFMEDEVGQTHRDDAKKHLKLAKHFLELAWASEDQRKKGK